MKTGRPLIANPDRPICPVCHVPTQRNGTQLRAHDHKVQVYTCPQCHAAGTLQTFSHNARHPTNHKRSHQTQTIRDVDYYTDPTGNPATATTNPPYDDDDPPICEICERHPAKRDGMCAYCISQRRRARANAATVPADVKRAEAQAANKQIRTLGYVKVGLRMRPYREATP